ncbi:discs large associated protein 2b isoform X2 [Anarrhichthys ocellatus]|uniref:discs large associated protein 2b isoform X2 n=1 Tax=Anarrhichthys ocellatus TaxID=433405 RepID=UPI0012EDBAAA|nr:disks large-associated protein 2-like isoform X2 [Anarrhichthys ocellatus]
MMHGVWVRIREGPTCVWRWREGVGAIEEIVNGGDPQFLPQVPSVCPCPHVPIVPLPSIQSMCAWSDSAVLYYICHPSFHLSQVLPWLLQTHCCLFFEKDSDQKFSPWSPSRKFNEDRRLPPARNMKGLSGSRSQHQIPLPYGLDYDPHVHDLHAHHGSESRHSSYLLSPTESCPMDFHHRYSPRSSIHSDCMMMTPVMMPPAAVPDHISSSTFPRMHYSSQYYDSATRDDCAAITASATSPAVAAAAAAAAASSHLAGTKSNRLPANLIDQFEKQMPLHRDGFHTLQYQRTSTTTEQRSESPGRIRHLVHSVQKLFTKSHSLEGSSKMNGTKGDIMGGGGGYHHHGHHSTKHGSKRSKSKERKHRSGGWWSSDDNLDSDSTYRTPSVMSRHHGEHVSHCYPDSMQSHHFGDLSLKTSKSNNDVKCSACESMAMAPEGKFMKRSSWSTLTVSQAKEAYRKSSLNLEKPMMHMDHKPSSRTCHYLQVPQDEWGGYPGENDDEIPCRRMRSSSYVKAMGEVDDESGDSDTSPKTSPQKAIRPDALVLKSAMQRPHLDSQSQGYHLQTTREMRPHPSVTLDPAAFHPPPFRSRNQSYMRAVSTLSQASCVSQVSETEINGQFESVCESVFSEVESQAMEALDLPGSFRTRSHSYLRAIQAGYSQDDDCLPSMTSSTVTSTLRSTTGVRSLAGGRREYGIQFRLPTSCSVDRAQPPPAVSYPSSYKKTPPPVPPRTTTKPLISVTAQSSTESTQDAYQEGRHPRGGLWTTDSLGRPIYSSVDSLDSTKAVTMAMESAAGKRHASLGSHTSVQTCDKAVLVSKAEEYLKTPRSSIGIQVETVTDSETESKGLPQFHSIGIQVEDHKRHGRFKRSNSVTTAVQADMELEGFPSMEDKGLQFGGGFGRHSEPSTPTQYGAIRTVRTQGLFSYREDYRPSSGPTSPQPETWLVEPSLEGTETGRVSPLRRDGSWFMQLLHNETKRLEGWCKEMEREAEEHDLTEESECPEGNYILVKTGAAFVVSVLGKIRSAVGSAQLLMSQKFQQFYWLCQQNLDPSAMPRPTSQDLAGFWDLLQLSIDDVTAKFDELQQIKSNQWQLVESPDKKERKWPPPLPKRPSKGRGGIMRERSLDLQDRQRQEARRRLMAAKRAASFRQNSVTERADSIEIYIPEAQTRL